MTQTTEYEYMASLLKLAGKTILKELSDYYPDAPKEIKGVRQWSGWCMTSTDPNAKEVIIPPIADMTEARKVLAVSQMVLQKGRILTSVSVRDPDLSNTGLPKVWGGSSLGAENYEDALYGGPELANHLVLSCLQRLAGRISEKRYLMQISIDYPGIEEAIAYNNKLGLTLCNFMSMRNMIEKALDKAAETL